ncbi:MAG: acetyl-CoA carboxylase biotin carboxylase subunit [Gammaproteobacteria bacterium]
MIKKILIANRGEIAMRIVRACAEMGIRSVALYSDADRNALHVKKADEAFHISASPLGGYLNPHRIMGAAAALGCDAIHPGYGFLSENPALAEMCRRHQTIKFIGPAAEVIAQMGDKVRARKAMLAAGVPVIPGSEGNLANAADAEKIAEKIGYPVMLKATNGGGGRGIRRCENGEEVRRNFPRIQSEAEKAFGRADIFAEKCIVRPRHIEVQILADGRGNIIHLFERDCSIQRRNQKLIEIAPSPQLSVEERAEVCAHAVAAARAVNYENAGTVEFLQDASRRFYFMEMNTRLQVEHTVSEQITGQDIVQEQIRIAGGEELSVWQGAVSHRGCAMEMRINAENPKNGFLPSFGRVTKYYAPGGPGVRIDGAIYTGYVIPPYYDSMCAKLTAWALTWPAVVHRALRALDDTQVSGIKTTIPFYRQILSHPDFRGGVFDTGFIDAHPELLDYKEKTPREDRALAIAAALVANLENN